MQHRITMTAQLELSMLLRWAIRWILFSFVDILFIKCLFTFSLLGDCMPPEWKAWIIKWQKFVDFVLKTNCIKCPATHPSIHSFVLYSVRQKSLSSFICSFRFDQPQCLRLRRHCVSWTTFFAFFLLVFFLLFFLFSKRGFRQIWAIFSAWYLFSI